MAATTFPGRGASRSSRWRAPRGTKYPSAFSRGHRAIEPMPALPRAHDVEGVIRGFDVLGPADAILDPDASPVARSLASARSGSDGSTLTTEAPRPAKPRASVPVPVPSREGVGRTGRCPWQPGDRRAPWEIRLGARRSPAPSCRSRPPRPRVSRGSTRGAAPVVIGSSCASRTLTPCRRPVQHQTAAKGTVMTSPGKPAPYARLRHCRAPEGRGCCPGPGRATLVAPTTTGWRRCTPAGAARHAGVGGMGTRYRLVQFEPAVARGENIATDPHVVITTDNPSSLSWWKEWPSPSPITDIESSPAG